MAVATADWKDEARSLREQGLSEREIAEAVGRAASSVHDAVKDVEVGEAPQPTPGQQTIDGGEVTAREELDEQAGPGEATGPLQTRPGEEPTGEVESVYFEQIRVDGTTQLAIDFGGKQAQSATLALSGKAEVDGFFRKGDRIRGTFEAVVVGAGGKDKLDKQTGIVVEAVQSHSAKITDLVIE